MDVLWIFVFFLLHYNYSVNFKFNQILCKTDINVEF